MSKQTIHETAIATQLGKMTFPQVVQALVAAGVESYLVDFAAAQKTHYLADGTTVTVPMILEPAQLPRSLTRVRWWRRFAGRRPIRCGTPNL